MAEIYFVKFPSNEYHCTLLMISQHWFWRQDLLLVSQWGGPYVTAGGGMVYWKNWIRLRDARGHAMGAFWWFRGDLISQWIPKFYLCDESNPIDPRASGVETTATCVMHILNPVILNQINMNLTAHLWSWILNSSNAGDGISRLWGSIPCLLML